MGKGQKRIQTAAENRSAEQHTIGTQASEAAKAAVAARKLQVGKRRAAIDAGTIGDQKDFVSNRAAVAERARQRDTRANLTKTGIAGLASNYADPTQIALADQANKDEFARDSAAQTESDAADYINQTNAMEENTFNAEVGTDMGVMNSAWGNSQNNLGLAAQIAASRASVVPGLIGAAIGAGTQVAAGSNWFQKK
jgi:hypothetical protein